MAIAVKFSGISIRMRTRLSNGGPFAEVCALTIEGTQQILVDHNVVRQNRVGTSVSAVDIGREPVEVTGIGDLVGVANFRSRLIAAIGAEAVGVHGAGHGGR